MNSRNSVNESNLVNLSADLSTINQLETKESLALSFPFDHIYACHSENPDRRQSLRLDKEVEISTLVTTEKDPAGGNNASLEVSRLLERLTAAEVQNKKLKELLIYHLDLIQEQNDLITKREKVFQALKQENDSLKTKVNRLDKKITVNRHTINPTPIIRPPNPPVTSTIVKNENTSTPSKVMFNSYTELLLPDTKTNSYIYNKDKSLLQSSYELNRSTESDVASYLTTELNVPTILDINIHRNNYTMIENKRSFLKKDMKAEARTEHLYTITSNSGNPVIQKIQRSRRRPSASIGRLSRLPKSAVIKTEPAEHVSIFDEDKSFDRTFSVNKKSKMINTYGKSRTVTIPKRPTHFTGSLSDRLQLIDTTPTGEDPYQLGEADMREQSPIPKLMLQKTNHGRLKICTDASGQNTITSRRIYDAPATETSSKLPNKIKLDNRYTLKSTITHPITQMKKESTRTKTLIVEEPDLDIVKTEPSIDWSIYTQLGNQTSLCDFSYDENPDTSALPNLDANEFQELFSTEPSSSSFSLNNLNADECMDKVPNDKTKRRVIRTTSLIAQEMGNESIVSNEDNRGRKRALSTTGLTKSPKQNLPKPVGPKPKIVKGKAPACRGKKSPVPGMITQKPYHTCVGDPDLSWYLGLDPDVKLEDIDQTGGYKASTVEVPRWREKPYTSCYSLEGTENLDDKVFEKRHQKLEAEERRQLRWHMRRIREQRHVERLRQRQRDPWSSGNGSLAHPQPSMFTVWPQPQRDVRLIEITDTVPVMAFGENLPELPPADFMLPWVRTSKALKRSKRSKTLH